MIDEPEDYSIYADDIDPLPSDHVKISVEFDSTGYSVTCSCGVICNSEECHTKHSEFARGIRR